MDIKDTQVSVQSLPFNEKGEKVEPEQQPAKMIQTSSAQVEHGGTETGKSMPISIEQHLTAGALAATVRDPCGTCRHFDRLAWQRQVKFLRSNYSGREMLNNVMAELLATQNISVQEMHTNPVDGDFDTDHAINSLGICRILSEALNDIVTVHPYGVCPPEMRSQQKPRGMYEAIDRDSDRAGSAAYDAILKAARGKNLK